MKFSTPESTCKLIAEIGLSHEGSLGFAFKFIEASKKSGADIKTIIKFLSNETRKDYSLISLKTVDENHPARMYHIKNSKLNPFMGSDRLSRDRRQDLDPVFIRDGGFYLISDSLAKKGILFAKNPNYFLRQYPWNINIDSKYDLAAAKSISNLEVVDDPNSKSHDYKQYL